MRSWPSAGVRVNPGRAPTPIGGDGILPFVDVPHWFAFECVKVLRDHRVEVQVLPAFIRRVGSDDPDDHMDRLVFPSARPEYVQWLLNTLMPPDCS